MDYPSVNVGCVNNDSVAEYDPASDTIRIGTMLGRNWCALIERYENDEVTGEIETIISILNHETIHWALYRMFNFKTTSLYDALFWIFAYPPKFMLIDGWWQPQYDGPFILNEKMFQTVTIDGIEVA